MLSIPFTAENHPALNHPHKKTLVHFTEGPGIQTTSNKSYSLK